ILIGISGTSKYPPALPRLLDPLSMARLLRTALFSSDRVLAKFSRLSARFSGAVAISCSSPSLLNGDDSSPLGCESPGGFFPSLNAFGERASGRQGTIRG